MKDNKIKVGDWVRIRIVGFGSDEPSYKVESIEGASNCEPWSTI